MDNEEGRGRYFGSSVADCFMAWVNILERAEKKGVGVTRKMREQGRHKQRPIP